MHKYFEINVPGHNIRCKMYYKENCSVERTVIFCTGFAGHKDNNAANGFAEKLISKDKHASVVVFNWPAHGDDVKKKLTLDDCNTYLEQVVAEMKDRRGIGELYAYATSFGGYLLLKYISEHDNPLRKIALRCPAVNMYNVLTNSIVNNDELERLMKGKELMVGFDRKVIITGAFLNDLKANDIRRRDFLDHADDILILHGTKDEVIPIDDSREFAEDNLIEFIPVENADHRFQNPTHMSLANKYVMEFFGML